MSDWGQGAKNNDIGWGQGAVNNEIGWGAIHALSYSGDTDIVGGVADPAFKMTIDTTQAGSASDTFILPLASGSVYDFDIDWGDGSSETITTSTNVTHVYDTAGEHQIAITGDFPRIFFNNTGDRLKLMSIDNFGDIVWGSTLQSAWQGCSNMVINANDVGNFGNVTNFSFAWFSCSSLTSFPFIDTSSGTNFNAAWLGCSNLTSFPLIDTSSGTNLQGAWRDCSSLTTFPANAFDTNIATNYSLAFFNTALLTQSIDDILVSLDASGVINGTFTQSGGQAPSATGEAAIDSLVGKGWTITVTGGYTP
jgi:hypothetical protein